MGFDVVDRLADQWGCALRRSLRFHARFGTVHAAGDELLLLKPQTFMNRSGESVGALLRYRKVEPSRLIVVLDDADLDVGQLRVKARGGSGGHRGLASIQTIVGSKEFVRVRIGIGRGRGRELVQHVLKPLPADRWEQELGPVVTRAAEAVVAVIEEGCDAAMNRFNASPPLGGQETA